MILFFFVFSNVIYSQETSITGLEKIHLAEGAILVTTNSQNEIKVIASNTEKIQNNLKVVSKEKKEAIAVTKPQANQQKIAKKSTMKEYKEKWQPRRLVMYKDANERHNAHFVLGDTTSKVAIGSSNYQVAPALITENCWQALTIFAKKKHNILYQLYHSVENKNSLFARPPPQWS